MAAIIKRNTEPTQFSQWDPFHMVREMLRWDPFREMTPTEYPTYERATFAPSFDVTETKDGYLFKADLPGVKSEDLEITTTGNRLQISGKRYYEHETKEETVYAYEREFGNFTRVFTLPDGVDLEHAKSELKEGVLTLVIPKVPSALSKKIPVAINAPKS